MRHCYLPLKGKESEVEWLWIQFKKQNPNSNKVVSFQRQIMIVSVSGYLCLHEGPRNSLGGISTEIEKQMNLLFYWS